MPNTHRWRMIAVALLASPLFVTGCALPIQTGASIQPGHDLGGYTSFAWNQPLERPTGDARLDENPLFIARVHAAIEWELTTRGIELNRDPIGELEMGISGRTLAVHHHTSIEDHVEVYEEDAGPAFMGEYGEGARVDASEEATFIVGLSDAYTGELVWSGWAVLNFEKALADPGVMQRRVDAAVAAMFESFPVSVGGAASSSMR